MIGLTHRQADALRFITGFMEANGRAPSVCEIWHGSKIGGKQRTFDLLNRLQERGYITRQPRKARSIEILHPLPIPRAPDGAPLYFVRLPQ